MSQGQFEVKTEVIAIFLPRTTANKKQQCKSNYTNITWLEPHVRFYYTLLKYVISVAPQVGNNARSGIAQPAKRSVVRPRGQASLPKTRLPSFESWIIMLGCPFEAVTRDIHCQPFEKSFLRFQRQNAATKTNSIHLSSTRNSET